MYIAIQACTAHLSCVQGCWLSLDKFPMRRQTLSCKFYVATFSLWVVVCSMLQCFFAGLSEEVCHLLLTKKSRVQKCRPMAEFGDDKKCPGSWSENVTSQIFGLLDKCMRPLRLLEQLNEALKRAWSAMQMWKNVWSKLFFLQTLLLAAACHWTCLCNPGASLQRGPVAILFFL